MNLDTFGLGPGYLIASILSLLILAAWIILATMALLSLRKYALPTTAAAIWTTLIICIPLFGALAFLIVKPENTRPE
ncbi:MAG: hypothetical protein GYA20_00325 [Chloroflexi bacterium]|jgi:hypothetical protein|nr:hypothetical protein [Chloroflexota bacterium]